MLIACFVGFALVHFFASLVLYIRDRKGSAENSLRILLLLSASTLVWNIVNILLLDDDFIVNNLPFSQFMNKVGFLMGLGVTYFSFLLSRYFPRRIKITRRFGISSKLPLLLVALGCFSPLISGTLSEGSNGKSEFEFGSLTAVYVLIILTLFVLTIINFSKSFRNEKDNSLRNQSLTILGGLIAMIVAALVFILLFPSQGVTQDWTYVIGYFSPYIFTGAVLYSMLKQQLFDIRSVVARAAAYILALGTVLIAPLAVLVYGSNKLVENLKNNDVFIYVNFAIALTFGLLYPKVKIYFDKITKKLFYKSVFEPDELIEKMGAITSREIDLHILVAKSLKTIKESLQSAELVMLLPDRLYALENDTRTTQNIEPQKPSRELQEIFSLSTGIKKDVVSIKDREVLENKKLHAYFIENKIECLLTLATKKVKLGFLVFAEKKDGTPYTKIEAKTLTVVGQQLSVALENAERFNEINNFNKNLQTKVFNATKELRQTNEKLKALDEAKDEFISMASHQLRTPLTSVKGYVSMVLEGDAGRITAQQKQLLEQAFASSQRMVYLIADLLNVSRLKTGKFVIERKPTLLSEIVESELEQLKESAKAHKLELTFAKPPALPLLNLDETKTRQVIMNFMDNAIYYTPAGGSIRVELTANDKVVEYRVIDNGIGVPKTEQHHLFTKFYRAGNAKKARPDGTGLGLFMAKKVIVTQGGSIIFSSEEGKGSTFGFSFPRAALEIEETKR